MYNGKMQVIGLIISRKFSINRRPFLHSKTNLLKDASILLQNQPKMRTCAICYEFFESLHELYVHVMMQHPTDAADDNIKHRYLDDAVGEWSQDHQGQPWGLSDQPIPIPELLRVFGEEDSAAKICPYGNPEPYKHAEEGATYLEYLNRALLDDTQITFAIDSPANVELSPKDDTPKDDFQSIDYAPVRNTIHTVPWPPSPSKMIESL